jgi:glycosyltransferase involved in cell wall biosynthesis
MVDDLLRQIANTQNLNGKLVIVEDPSDAELVELYAGCLFTLFPSYYEGWGLPVTESLAFGKPCFISNRTSLPEAGGGLARCFDPEKIRSVLEDRQDLMLWEDKVRREFRPVPWSATVAALLAELRHPLAGTHRAGAMTDGAAD